MPLNPKPTLTTFEYTVPVVVAFNPAPGVNFPLTKYPSVGNVIFITSPSS